MAMFVKFAKVSCIDHDHLQAQPRSPPIPQSASLLSGTGMAGCMAGPARGALSLGLVDAFTGSHGRPCVPTLLIAVGCGNGSQP